MCAKWAWGGPTAKDLQNVCFVGQTEQSRTGALSGLEICEKPSLTLDMVEPAWLCWPKQKEKGTNEQQNGAKQITVGPRCPGTRTSTGNA